MTASVVFILVCLIIAGLCAILLTVGPLIWEGSCQGVECG